MAQGLTGTLALTEGDGRCARVDIQKNGRCRNPDCLPLRFLPSPSLPFAAHSVLWEWLAQQGLLQEPRV